MEKNTQKQEVMAGVDSNMTVHTQLTTKSGWRIRTEYIPPSTEASKIMQIVGHVEDGDVEPLSDTDCQEILSVI